MKTFLARIGGAVAIVCGPIWHGYILSIAWGWFVTPTFTLPRLGIAAAIGLTATVRMVTYQHIEDKSEEKPLGEQWAEIFLRSFFVPAVMLLFCWIVKHWM